MTPDGKKSAKQRKNARECWLEEPCFPQTIVLALRTTDTPSNRLLLSSSVLPKTHFVNANQLATRTDVYL